MAFGDIMTGDDNTMTMTMMVMMAVIRKILEHNKGDGDEKRQMMVLTMMVGMTMMMITLMTMTMAMMKIMHTTITIKEMIGDNIYNETSDNDYTKIALTCSVLTRRLNAPGLMDGGPCPSNPSSPPLPPLPLFPVTLAISSSSMDLSDGCRLKRPRPSPSPSSTDRVSDA
jgi:hypothetical protein